MCIYACMCLYEQREKCGGIDIKQGINIGYPGGEWKCK